MNLTATVTLLAAKVREIQRVLRSKMSESQTVNYVTTTVTAADATSMKKAQNLSDVASVASAIRSGDTSGRSRRRPRASADVA